MVIQINDRSCIYVEGDAEAMVGWLVVVVVHLCNYSILHISFVHADFCSSLLSKLTSNAILNKVVGGDLLSGMEGKVTDWKKYIFVVFLCKCFFK